jgi:gamma-glutamyltranspeptidase / glutathione hydrolase
MRLPRIAASRGRAGRACGQVALLAALLAIAGCSANGRVAPGPAAAASAAEARPAVTSPAPGDARAGAPEAKPVRGWRAGAMVAAANPLAVEAGLEILRAGGSAVDAAIAIQAVLGLVEPQSSGLGGGAFLMYFDAASGDVLAYDGREVAPRGASPGMFLGADGAPLRFPDAVRSGRSIGVPGLVAMLADAHREQGRLPWAAAWQPAIELAEAGFEVSPRLNAMIGAWRGALAPDAARYLTVDGAAPLPVGARLRNPEYGATLRRIATEGARGFYEGPVAAAMVAAAARAPLPGSLGLDDLKAYRPQRLEPVCRGYRAYLVCGMRPPSSGGIAVLSILGILEHFDLAASGPGTALGWHRFIEAQRLAYADRDMYVADDRFVQVPIAGLLDRGYLGARAALVDDARAMATVAPGTPPGAQRRGADGTGPEHGTSHFVVVDGRGDVVSMTTTVEAPFGSQRMAAGFFLNNQLTDFSFRAVDSAGHPIANAPAPLKKPRSSMSPTLVFEDGAFRLAVGSPGGNSIIGYVSKVIVGVLDWGLTPQQAIELPNVVARGPVAAEASRMDPALVESLKAMGHQFSGGRGGEGSGLHAIQLTRDGRLVGGADSRREGRAVALP